MEPQRIAHGDDQLADLQPFGIAQLGTEDTVSHTGQMLGTAAYIAPEQALGKPATDASDRYALAVAAFELLVGERPFAAETPASQARQHLEDDPPRASQRNPSLPGALDAVLARGLAKRPEERWPTAGQLADAIDGALHARAAVATINPNTATIGPWRTRQPQSRRPVSRRAAVAATRGRAVVGGDVAAG